jgi:hypothetical protein
MIPCDEKREPEVKPLGDEALKTEQVTAEEYASKPERFTFSFIEVEVKGENGSHLVLYGKDWSCDCDFFKEQKTCSHVMAVGRVLKTLTIVQPRGNVEEIERSPSS